MVGKANGCRWLAANEAPTIAAPLPQYDSPPMSFRPTLALLAALFILLGGCAPKPALTDRDQERVEDQRPAPTRIESALSQLLATDENLRAGLSIAWAREYLHAGRSQDADTLLDLVDPQDLEDNLRLEWVIVAAQVRLTEQDTEGALRLLSSRELRIPALTARAERPLRGQLLLLRADAMAMQGDLLASIQERVSANTDLPPERREYNQRMIWLLLVNLPRAELKTLLDSTELELLGWAELADIYRDPLADIDTQAGRMADWQKRWQGHPAEQDQPAMVQALRRAIRERPEQIAVLLPASGPLAAAGDAVRDGILAAYFTALEQGHPVPALRFYDSSNSGDDDDIIELYNRALQNGAEFVIGPLERDQARLLARVDRLPVPTLALNYVDLPEVAGNLVQFGLAPEDEARQVARQGRAEGAQLAAILYPRSDWGQRVAQAFTEQWQELDGVIATEGSYANNASASVRELLGIGRSEARLRELARLIGPLEFEPRRRQDIDFVFLLGNPAQARQIKPALNFHYASDLPVMATSHIYSGRPDPSRDGDLNGIRFVDIPWLLDRDSALHEQTGEIWPQGHGRYERLFALGLDAWRLQARLPLLQSVPDSRLPGATGQLAIEEQNRLSRELDWAWFRSGRPMRVPVISSGREVQIRDQGLVQ